MLPVGFEPAIPASERPETHELESSATGIGQNYFHYPNFEAKTASLRNTNNNLQTTIALGLQSAMNIIWVGYCDQSLFNMKCLPCLNTF